MIFKIKTIGLTFYKIIALNLMKIKKTNEKNNFIKRDFKLFFTLKTNTLILFSFYLILKGFRKSIIILINSFIKEFELFNNFERFKRIIRKLINYIKV